MRSKTTYAFAGNQAYWPLAQGSGRKSSDTSSASSGLSAKLSNLVNSLFVQMTAASEPRIWKRQDADGCTLWNAYDSASDRLVRDVSENELRVWLETRYRA